MNFLVGPGSDSPFFGEEWFIKIDDEVCKKHAGNIVYVQIFEDSTGNCFIPFNKEVYLTKQDAEKNSSVSMYDANKGVHAINIPKKEIRHD